MPRENENFDVKERIDERIQALIDWNKKYPDVEIFRAKLQREVLKKYAASEEEFEQLVEQYIKMKQYYMYISERRRKGILTPEQEEMCREGNIRGVFGYPTKVQELARRFRISEDKINYILGKYKTMEKLLAVYKQGKLDEQDITILQENLQKQINIGGTNNRGLVTLASYVTAQDRKTGYLTDNNLTFFDTAKLLKILYDLPEDERAYIQDTFGFVTGKRMTRTEIAQTYGVTKYMVDTRLKRGLRKSTKYSIDKGAVFADVKYAINHGNFTPEQQEIINVMKAKIFNSNLIFQPDEKYALEPADISESELRQMISTVREIIGERDKGTSKGKDNSMKSSDSELGNLLARRTALENESEEFIAEIRAKRESIEKWNKMIKGNSQEGQDIQSE